MKKTIVEESMKRFSTDELVDALDSTRRSEYWDSKIDAIIAKLRAADALCEEAKFPRNGRVVELRKAIAEYENSHD